MHSNAGAWERVSPIFTHTGKEPINEAYQKEGIHSAGKNENHPWPNMQYTVTVIRKILDHLGLWDVPNGNQNVAESRQ